MNLQFAPGVKDNGRNEFGPHYGRCGWVLSSFNLRSCDFGAAGRIDLFAVRSLFSLFSLHLAKFATREIIATAGLIAARSVLGRRAVDQQAVSERVRELRQEISEIKSRNRLCQARSHHRCWTKTCMRKGVND
jgi:hypothetical protein